MRIGKSKIPISYLKGNSKIDDFSKQRRCVKCRMKINVGEGPLCGECVAVLSE